MGTTVVRIAAGIYLAYMAISLLVVLPALNILLPRLVQEATGRQLQAEIILFNPFTVALEARRVVLPEASGERFASLDRASVNLSLASIWQPGLVLDALRIDQLFLHIVRIDDSGYNFSSLLPPTQDAAPAAPEEAASDPGLPAFTIHELDFSAQKIAYTDPSRVETFNTHLEGLDIQVQDLSTVLVEGRPYRIDARAESGGRLHWEGDVSIPGARSEGRLSLSGVSLHPAWRFVRPLVNFKLQQAHIDVSGQYQVDWSDGLAYSISDAAVTLSGVDMQPESPQALPDTAIQLAKLAVSGISVQSVGQSINIEQVSASGLAVDGWSEGERVSLAELFATATTGDPQAGTDENESGGDTGWSAQLGQFRLVDSRVHWRSEFTEPSLLQLSPIEVTLENLSWPLSGQSELDLQLTANDQALLAIDGALLPASGEGLLSYRLQDLPLAWFNPNLPAALHGQITDGVLAVDGSVTLADQLPATLGMTGAITGFAGKVRDAELSLTSWEAVRWKNLQLDLQQRSLDIEQVAIDDYSGRLHIFEDGTINAQHAWRQEAAADAAITTGPEPEEEPAGTPWRINIPSVRVTDSQLDFMDESLPIKFRTLIGNLNGELAGISTDPGAVASVDLKGAVDNYAPVALRGTAAPFNDPPNLDLGLTFDGVDLALLTPYSGTYAGHAIDRGLLNLDLQYSLQDNRLKGSNDVHIDKLKLGAKIDSDKAVDLPLELALALLTDMNGVIEMSVPVSGAIDDPEFGLGSIIFKAFVNLIMKAVTSPFSLLANLVGSEEDLRHISFSSGSGELDEAGRNSLQQLHAALSQRPALGLVITGRLHPRADREKLQELALTAQLLEAGLIAQEVDSKGPAWEEAVADRYQREAGAAADSASELTPQQQYAAMLAGITVSDAQLLELATARAATAKDFLVSQLQLDPARAVIEQASIEDEANLFSGVELQVDI